MKLYKIFFSTDSDISPFGEIPEIIKEAELIGLQIKFISGGWEKSDSTYYHEWESIDDSDIVKNFAEKLYKGALISFHTEIISSEENDAE